MFIDLHDPANIAEATLSANERLSRISKHNHEQAHQRLKAYRLKGTTQWVVEHPTFAEWLVTSQKSLMWLSGASEHDFSAILMPDQLT